MALRMSNGGRRRSRPNIAIGCRSDSGLVLHTAWPARRTIRVRSRGAQVNYPAMCSFVRDENLWHKVNTLIARAGPIRSSPSGPEPRSTRRSDRNVALLATPHIPSSNPTNLRFWLEAAPQVQACDRAKLITPIARRRSARFRARVRNFSVAVWLGKCCRVGFAAQANIFEQNGASHC